MGLAMILFGACGLILRQLNFFALSSSILRNPRFADFIDDPQFFCLAFRSLLVGSSLLFAAALLA